MNNTKNWPMSIPGSKRRMIPKIWPLLPKPIRASECGVCGGDRVVEVEGKPKWAEPCRNCGRFVVPFFGTGVDSGFMRDHGHDVIAGDSQSMLIGWHKNAVEYVDRARAWVAENIGPDDGWNKVAFLRLRSEYNANPEPWALYLLGKLAFSQLIRHNSSGEYNAHWGQVRELPSPEVIEQHAAFIDSLHGLFEADFEDVIKFARPHDVVYLDPPYLGTFDAYTAERFDTPRLIRALVRLSDLGIPWAVSNSPAFESEIIAVVPDVEIHKLDRAGTISVNMQGRQSVKEILVVWRPQNRFGESNP